MVQTYVSSKILVWGWTSHAIPIWHELSGGPLGEGSPLNLTKTQNILAGQKNALPFAAPLNTDAPAC